MKTIRTRRLILRSFRETDARDVFGYAKSPNVGPNAGWRPHADVDESRAIIRRFIEENDVWALVEKATGRVVGSVGLHIDDRRRFDCVRMLGYALCETRWGRGYMAEAVAAALDFAFTHMKLAMVTVYHYPENLRSKRVIERAGFTFEGMLRMCARYSDGSAADLACYSMTREEYLAVQAGKGKAAD
jgi:putative acetyltransferase